MKTLFACTIAIVMMMGCKSSKSNTPDKKCDTCPSLSNEGKIAKPFKNKKKK